MAAVTLDIFSDIACPWCYVAKRFLRQALATGEAGDVEIRWRAYMLNPNLPQAGLPAEAYFAARFGSMDKAREAYERVSEVGALVGIRFDFDAMPVAPNTLLAHRLVALARARGADADEVVDALFRAHFEQGRNVGDPDELTKIAVEAGLDMGDETVSGLLAADEHLADVIADFELAERMSVQGVPMFIANEKLGVSGAQSPEVLLELLRIARERDDAPTTA